MNIGSRRTNQVKVMLNDEELALLDKKANDHGCDRASLLRENLNNSFLIDSRLIDVSAVNAINKCSAERSLKHGDIVASLINLISSNSDIYELLSEVLADQFNEDSVKWLSANPVKKMQENESDSQNTSDNSMYSFLINSLEDAKSAIVRLREGKTVIASFAAPVTPVEQNLNAYIQGASQAAEYSIHWVSDNTIIIAPEGVQIVMEE